MAYHPFITSSGIDRFLRCTGSASLPKVTNERSPFAVAGVEEHAVRLQREQLPRKVLDWFGGVDPDYEVAFAVDILDDTTPPLCLGQYIERGYPPLPGPRWLCGTADMVQVVDGGAYSGSGISSCNDGVVSVADLKTGRGQARGALPHPAESGQLLSLAWMAIRLRQHWQPGWTPSRIRLAFWLTHDRPDDIDDAEIDYPTLQRWVANFRAEVARTQHHGSLRLSRGPQCTNCGSFDACPAQGGAIRRVAELSGRIVGGDADELSDGDIATAMLDLEAAERACETARAAIKRRVEDRGEVAVDATHRLKLIRGTDTRIDIGVAADVLGDNFARCATISLSQAGLRRGLGTQDIVGVMDEIGRRGGLSSVPKSPYLRVVKTRKGEG